MSTTKKIDISLIAEYFIWKSNSEKRAITNKKLQKLLYYSQAWFLATQNKKLFPDKLEAWVHGPAVRKVYVAYKKFGYQPIQQVVTATQVGKLPKATRDFLDNIWSVYGRYDAAYLENLTHSEEPWQKAREGIEAHMGSEQEISTDDMKTFYSAKLHKR